MRSKSVPPSKAVEPAKPGFLSTQITEARRFFLNLNPGRVRGIEVVCGGVERCREDYVMKRATFPYLAIEFVAEGLGSLRLAGKEWPLRPGTAFAYAAGVSHTIRNHPGHPMLKYYIDFVGAEAQDLLQESPLGKWEAVQVGSPNAIIEILEELQRNGEAQSRFSARICAHLAAILILKISDRMIPVGPQESRAFPSYQRVRLYIDNHFQEMKTVEEAAAACHVNVSYLCRLFQRFHHRTPYQYLMRLKMNKAAGLLLDSGKQIKEVASELGFEEPCSFSRAFKNVYGLCPQAFLKRGHRSGSIPEA